MRMWGGSLTKVTPSLVQVILGVAVVESAVQYSQITDPSTMLWTPPRFWNRTSGRVVTVSWPFTADDLVGGRGEGGDNHGPQLASHNVIDSHSSWFTIHVTVVDSCTCSRCNTEQTALCNHAFQSEAFCRTPYSVRHIIVRTTAVIVSGHACIHV